MLLDLLLASWLRLLMNLSLALSEVSVIVGIESNFLKTLSLYVARLLLNHYILIYFVGQVS